MEVDGVSLTVGGAAVSALAGVAGAYIKAKFGKTEIPQPMKTELTHMPLPVTGDISMRKDQKYVSTGEFNERMKKVDSDIAAVRNDVSILRSDITNSNRAVIEKLDEIDKRSEDRAIALNRRMDPLIEKVAANSEAVDFIKKAAINSTVGGKK